MFIIEQQLTKYYKSRGMKGPILRACVKYDVGRLWHYYTEDLSKSPIQSWAKHHFTDLHISQVIFWEDTTEGDRYWRVRDGA